MSGPETVERYCLANSFIYIDLQEIRRRDDLSTLPFRCQTRQLDVRIPPRLQEEIRAAAFPSEQTYLLLTTRVGMWYQAECLAWSVDEALIDGAFAWLLIEGEHVSLQPVECLRVNRRPRAAGR